MNVETEVKKVARSKWFWLVVGILAGGTVLGGVVAVVVGRARGWFGKLTGGGVANTAALAQQGK